MATSNPRKRSQKENQAILDSWLCKKSKSGSEEVYDEDMVLDPTREDGKHGSCSLTDSVAIANSYLNLFITLHLQAESRKAQKWAEMRRMRLEKMVSIAFVFTMIVI